MIQEILTWITVISAFSYMFYAFWKTLASAPGNSVCGGGCSHCEAKDLLINEVKGKSSKLKGER